MILPLDGIRVLDLSRLAPGPFCTMVLGDLGADVIVIEEPGGGRRARIEWARGTGKDDDRARRLNPLWRNKRSVVLDLKQREAQEALHRLCKTADVLVEGFRPGVTRRLGADYESLCAINPRLVYSSITGYGQDGPYARLPGHDLNYLGVAGALSFVGRADEPPLPPANLTADFGAGAYQAVIGILSALLARARTGRGQYLDVSMTDGVVSFMGLFLFEHLLTGSVPRRGSHRLAGGAAYYGVYEAADGKYLALGCTEPWIFERLCDTVGLPEFRQDQLSPPERQAELRLALADAFRTQPRDTWLEILWENDIAASPVHDIDEVLIDPHVVARGLIWEDDAPGEGKVRQVAPRPVLSDTPANIRRIGARRGEHTREVLVEAGYRPDELTTLLAMETSADA